MIQWYLETRRSFSMDLWLQLKAFKSTLMKLHGITHTATPSSSWIFCQGTPPQCHRQGPTRNSLLTTVDGRNLTPPDTWGVLNLVDNGINYQPQLVGRISEPSTAWSHALLPHLLNGSTWDDPPVHPPKDAGKLAASKAWRQAFWPLTSKMCFRGEFVRKISGEITPVRKSHDINLWNEPKQKSHLIRNQL